MKSSLRPILVIEDDPFLRLIQVALDPDTSTERHAAFAEFMAHDLPDFDGWCRQMQDAAGPLYPIQARMVASEREMQEQLSGAVGLVVESLEIGESELNAASDLRVIQKFGSLLRNIDTAACVQRGMPILTQRRRANIACAEHTIAMMLTMARRLNTIGGLISVPQLEDAGFKPGSFDRRHTANSGWPRIGGLKMLYESTLGILGMGEIGRELARRIAPFGMRTLYHQRHPLSADEESELGVEYVDLTTLLGESDWLSVQLPLNDATRGFLTRELVSQVKPGAVIVNTSRAELIDRDAVVNALRSGQLGGFALDPLYEEPGRADDELLQFENVFLTPHTAAQPRFNALRDMEEMIRGMSATLYPR